MFINYKREIYALAHLNLSTASFKCLNAIDVLCAQLTRDLLAIAKFLLYLCNHLKMVCGQCVSNGF